MYFVTILKPPSMAPRSATLLGPTSIGVAHCSESQTRQELSWSRGLPNRDALCLWRKNRRVVMIGSHNDAYGCQNDSSFAIKIPRCTLMNFKSIPQMWNHSKGNRLLQTGTGQSILGKADPCSSIETNVNLSPSEQQRHPWLSHSDYTFHLTEGY